MAPKDSGIRTRGDKSRSRRKDGRVQFLVFLPPRLVKSIKAVALQQDKYAYQLVEDLLTEGLDRLDDPILVAIDYPAGSRPDAREGEDGAMGIEKKEE